MHSRAMTSQFSIHLSLKSGTLKLNCELIVAYTYAYANIDPNKNFITILPRHPKKIFIPVDFTYGQSSLSESKLISVPLDVF